MLSIPGAPGQAMDPDGFAFVGQLAEGVCDDCTVLSGKFDLVFENGTHANIANGVYLHHLSSTIEGKTQPTWVKACPGDPSKQLSNPLAALMTQFKQTTFVGGAVDPFYDYFTSQDGKFDSGFYMPEDAVPKISGEIINYRMEPQKVYIQLDLEWVDGRVKGEAIKTSLNVEGCSMPGTAFKKGGDKGEVKSEPFEVLMDGTLLLASKFQYHPVASRQSYLQTL